MSPSANQPLTIDDFSGGRTDNYFLAPLNQYYRCDNLFPTAHGQRAKLLSRPGMELVDSAFPKANPDGTRVATLTYFQNEILAIAARKIRYNAGAGWTELLGPVTSNSLFPVGTTTANVNSYSQWNNHLFITNDSYPAPSKVYRDGSNVRQLRTAGLPHLASDPNAQLASFAAGVTSFLYKFVYKYTYVVGTVTFIDRGAPTDSAQALAANPPNVDSIVIENIPVLSNGLIYNWDTANIKVEVYRTLANGQVFYFVGEVTNGTTTYTDTTSDATLIDSEKLYTEGGVIANDPVPLAACLYVFKDKGYYGNIKEGSELFKNRIYQSVPGDIDSVPSTFFVDVQDDVVGIGSARGLVIAVCATSVYRIDGEFDLLGRGGMVATRIGETSDCISSQSIVVTPEGLFWAGQDYYYYSDGYQVLKINQDWTDSYRVGTEDATLQKRIQGKYDRRNRRVWWTIQTETGLTDDCSKCDVLHLEWGVRDNSSFTTVSGEEEFSPTALEFVGDDLYSGNRYGYLLIHSDDILTDIKVDDTVAATTWSTQTILWDYVSVATDFGVPNMRKYTPRIVFAGRNLSNASIQVTSIEDDGRVINDLKPIRWRANFTWGDPLFVWGNLDCIWGFAGLIEEQRRFPASSLRCDFKQIQISNAFVPIINSDSFGTVTVNSTLATVTFDSLITATWPTDPIDYVITLASDNYVTQYPVIARTATTLTLLDSGGQLPDDTTVEWELSGYPKNERLNVMSFSVDFIPMGATEQGFTNARSGEVSS